MITISKRKLKRPLIIISLILIITAGSFYIGTVFSIPAANINCVCEPGACSSQDCSYYVYRNQILANDNTTLIKNCQTGANDYSGSPLPVAFQRLFHFLAAVSQRTRIPPTGSKQNTTHTVSV